MKTTLLSLVAVLFAAITTQAQVDVLFNINHKLGFEPFAFNSETTNNLGQSVEFIRFEYYISGISITHDGGQMTDIEDFWILVDASESTNINLGNYDIMNVEAVSFYIGVDPDHNHLNPADWPAGHPLAPQNPSMHWGWDPGYRFVAAEGSSGPNTGFALELHGLGDQNYFQQEITLSAEAVSGIVVIDLDGDYSRSLEDISIQSGTIVHGDYGNAQKCLQNMRDYVFTPAGSIVGIEEQSSEANLVAFPNPAGSGFFNLTTQLTNGSGYTVQVVDNLGKVVFEENQMAGSQTFVISNLAAGVYTATLSQEGRSLANTRVFVK